MASTKEEIIKNLTAVANRYPEFALTDRNFALLKAKIEAQAGGTWSENNIEFFVKEQWNQLDKEQPAAPVAADAPPAEVLVRLNNGDMQLPLDASEYTVRKSSVEQVRDLTRRRYAASGKTVRIDPSHTKSQENF